MKLNESGASAEIKCPYCGYPNASDMYESRGNPFKYKSRGYNQYRICYICGWEQYESDTDEITIAPKADRILEAKRIVKIYLKIQNMSDSDEAIGMLEDYIISMPFETYQSFLTEFIKYILKN
jgi:hypothetical protein